MSEIGRTMPCWECNGSGVVADEDKRCVRCPACDDGWLEVVPAEQLAAALRLLAEAQPGGTMPPGDAQHRWWGEVKALMLEHCL